MKILTSSISDKSWETAELGDLISIVAGHTFKQSEYSDKGVRLLQIANVSFQEISWEEKAYLPLDYIEEYPKLVLKPGDLIMALNRPILGRKVKFAILSQSDCPAILYQRVGKFIFNSKKVIRDFLYVFMQTDYFLYELKKRLAGSDQPYINPTELIKIRVPVPPLEEQKKIAAIAQKADRLRRTRRYALQLSDTFLQSVFLEMFGDPVTNPKGWAVGILDDVIISAKDGPHVSPTYADSGIPFLSARNVRKGEIIWEGLKFISLEDAKEHWKKCKPQRGDILYTKGGTTGLAKAVDFDREIAVWVHIAVLKLKHERVNTYWLESMLNSEYCYKQSQELTFGIVNRDLGLQRMPKIKIYIPPLPLQEKFAQIVQKFERLRTQQREAERQAEHLFQTILHRAFRGELFSQDFKNDRASDFLEQIDAEQTTPKAETLAANQTLAKASKNAIAKSEEEDLEAIQLNLPF